MNRNETFSVDKVDRIDLRLSWATPEIATADVDAIQVYISGSEIDTPEVKVELTDGRLLIEQPMYGISYHIASDHWMQILVRLPRVWKGAVSAATTTAPLSVSGITGTDIQLSTVTGRLRAEEINSIELALRSVSGSILGRALTGTKLATRNVSAETNLECCSFREYQLSGVSGDVTAEMTTAFEKLNAIIVNGDISITAPVTQLDLNYHTVSGRLQTAGVDLVNSAIPASVNSVTGALTITASPGIA